MIVQRKMTAAEDPRHLRKRIGENIDWAKRASGKSIGFAILSFSAAASYGLASLGLAQLSFNNAVINNACKVASYGTGALAVAGVAGCTLFAANGLLQKRSAKRLEGEGQKIMRENNPGHVIPFRPRNA